MRKQVLILPAVCVLLGALSGCHKPINAVVLIPDQGAHPGDPAAVYAETNGTVEFREEGKDLIPFTVTILDEKTMQPNALVCREGATLNSELRSRKKNQFQMATCHVNTDKAFLGDFKYTIAYSKERKTMKETHEFYIRPCPPVCKTVF